MDYYQLKSKEYFVHASFSDDGFVRIFPAGGGFESKVEENSFNELYQLTTPDFSFKKGTVTADFDQIMSP